MEIQAPKKSQTTLTDKAALESTTLEKSVVKPRRKKKRSRSSKSSGSYTSQQSGEQTLSVESKQNSSFILESPNRSQGSNKQVGIASMAMIMMVCCFSSQVMIDGNAISQSIKPIKAQQEVAVGGARQLLEVSNNTHHFWKPTNQTRSNNEKPAILEKKKISLLDLAIQKLNHFFGIQSALEMLGCITLLIMTTILGVSCVQSICQNTRGKVYKPEDLNFMNTPILEKLKQKAARNQFLRKVFRPCLGKIKIKA